MDGDISYRRVKYTINHTYFFVLCHVRCCEIGEHKVNFIIIAMASGLAQSFSVGGFLFVRTKAVTKFYLQT